VISIGWVVKGANGENGDEGLFVKGWYSAEWELESGKWEMANVKLKVEDVKMETVKWKDGKWKM
jgi:hypothetical protein